MACGPIQFYPNEDIKILNQHQVNNHLHTLLLSIGEGLFSGGFLSISCVVPTEKYQLVCDTL